jgi:hypothetical protein
MKTPNKKNRSPVIITSLLILGLLLVLGGYTAIAYRNHFWPFHPEAVQTSADKIDLNPPTSEQINTGKDIKNAAQDAANQPTIQGSQVDLTITSVNQSSTSLQIRTLIQATTNNGTCSLTLTKNGSTVTRTASVQAAASSSTCEGFDIPLNELSAGKWQMTIKFNSGSINGEVSQEVSVN